MRKIFAFLTLLLCSAAAFTAAAQERAVNIRYVTKAGKYANDGLTWATAKNNIQDAINDLVDKGLSGEVWVARGTYTPTESTEATGGSTLYMAFKVPAGITIRGGFFGPGEVPGAVDADSLTYFKQLMGETYKAVKEAADPGVTINIDDIKAGDFFPGEDVPDQRALYRATIGGVSADATYPYISILSGDLSQNAKFEWNAVKKFWDASFYGNSYHVVWFATNGFDSDGRAKALDATKGDAVVEGFTIMNGNARNTDLNVRAHNAYGGGVYMTQGSRLENCQVMQCEASRDGGGIYMDGGGVVQHCYIQNCQALGIGAQNGYGGGVCLDANKKTTTQRMGVYRSVINGCVARMGGGAAIKTEKYKLADGSDLRYKPFLSATAIYNNTATIEGGGMYMLNGGAVSNLTITRNQCNGTGVVSNGMETGRAGGLYCRDHAVVYNSVLWGNECKSNNDLQFTSSQSGTDLDLKVEMKYCAVAFADHTDWSTTVKENVFNISNYNTAQARDAANATASESDVFPHFTAPTPNAGYVNIKVNPAEKTTQTQAGLRRFYDWQPGANSGLSNAGVIALDLNFDGDLPFRSIYKDVLGDTYNPRATIGAYTRRFGRMTPVEKTGDGGAKEYHFFVDPDASTARPIDDLQHGVSWEKPAHFISNVLYTIYNDPGKYSGVKTYIHVKEGTLGNTNSYVYDKRVREMTIGVRTDNLVILGGYPNQMTGTNTEAQTIEGVEYKRNPLRYPTFISGRITGEYRMNAAHLMQFDDCENVIFDGFQIRYANASSSLFDASSTDGGAIRLINGAKNITFRNLIITGNTADRGAAIFAEDGTSATFENVIIHNNESKKLAKSDTRQGIIHTLGNAALTFKHCNILNNVGYAAYLDGTSTQQFTNTIFFANGKDPLPNAYGSEAINNALPSFGGSNAATGATGSYCLFDAASASFQTNFGTHLNADVAKYQYDLNYELNQEGFPRFVNGVRNVGVSEGGDETYYGRATSFEPHNENPMVNAASYTGEHTTWGYDLSTIVPRTYGGLPDIGAIENHAGDGKDGSYAGGQQPYGSVIYVRDYHTYEGDTRTATDFETTHPDGVKRDGSSWENAINGNATYGEYIPEVPDSYENISIEEAVNGNIPVRLALIIEDDLGNTLGYIEGNNINNNNASLVGAGTLPANGDEFLITKTNDGYYRIRHSSSRKYLRYRSGNNNWNFNLRDDTNYSSWTVSGDETNGYVFSRYRDNSRTYYLGMSEYGTTVSTSTSTNNFRYKWVLTKKIDGTPASSTEALGLRYAIEKANAAWKLDNSQHDVYVGAGIYTDNLVMLEGVNVLGGFPRSGNPGEDERVISNNEEGYMTFLDGNNAGRTLTQEEDFNTATTMFEGFIIQHGKSSNLEYGAGVHLRKGGILKNCLVINNEFTVGSQSAAGGGGVYINTGGLVKNSIIRQNTLRNPTQTLIGGAGVHANGGELQNSLIVENTAYTTGINVLGAGFYISSLSYLYNCTIAYNVGNNTGTDNPTGGQIGGTPCTGGVWDGSAKSQGKSQFYNCIMWGNYATGTTRENYFQVGMSGFSSGGGIANDAFHDCYSSAASERCASDVWSDEYRVYQINTDDAANNYPAFYSECLKHEPFSRKDDGTTDYDLKSSAYQCINRGGSMDVLETLGITEDIVGDNRVIDCTVDKGAYEYYDSYAITPRVITKTEDGVEVIDETKAATFYVTPFGRGLASGDSPDNAACWQKLQRVLDAAGRYKYQHPRQQIIVKVAHSHTWGSTETPFKYAATRTSDETSDDVRVWSIIIPRGVEVWGGYCDSYTSADDNGFYLRTNNGDGTYTITDRRSITENPTYFDSNYVSTELNSDVNTYHVVTFTDRVFDGDQVPYMVGDKIGEASSYNKGKATPEVQRRDVLADPDPASSETFMLMSDPYSHNDEAAGIKWGGVTDRAVLDGIYVTSGQADLQTISSGSTTLNINRYGGAAIVTDFAHMRNCIIRENKGVYGGALALTHNALVSGCLIDRNTADYGGAIYVFEHGVELSDGTIIDTENSDYDVSKTDYKYRFDYEMPHVYSTTIVNNSAVKQGGGVWFGTTSPNVRFNSTVVWANICPDQPDVSGLYNITRGEGEDHTTTEYYPFNYCALRNIQASGLNNISIADLNKNGARFQDGNKTDDRHAMAVEKVLTAADDPFDKYDNFGLFGLTNYSLLNRGGMPLTEWKKLNEERKFGLAEEDFMDVSREVADPVQSTTRTNIEIGARAFDKHFPNDQLMLRIFVAKPEDVDVEASTAMQMGGIGAANGSLAQFYAQEGSSFAYPMTKLQDALDYIYKQRGFILGDAIDEDCKGLTDYHANNMRFEIFLGPGVYYPSLDPTGNNNHSVGATFVVPEGVSLAGGYDPLFAVNRAGNTVTGSTTEKHFYGKNLNPKMGSEYLDPTLPTGEGRALWDANSYNLASNAKVETTDSYQYEYNGITYNIHHVDKETCGKHRALIDINANSIVEPWEFANQTILSGQLEGANNSGVNHVVTIHADQAYVGALPYTQGPDTHGAQHARDRGYEPHEFGQIIAFDGLTFKGGYAYGYQAASVDDEHKMKYNHGGAILIDTNRYWNYYNKKQEQAAGVLTGTIPDSLVNRSYLYGTFTGAAGFREIPVMVNKCKFENNIAGYGGAISSNTTLDVLNSSFEHNMALSGGETVDYTFSNNTINGSVAGKTFHIPVSYPGAGGAIYSTYQLSAINTLFANNEARDTKFQKGTQQYAVLTNSLHQLRSGTAASEADLKKNSSIMGGSGGAVFLSRKAHFHFMNCNFVRNQANAYPAIFTYNPNSGTHINDADLSLKTYNQALNSVFWGNAVNEKVKTLYSTDATYLYSIDKIVNYGRHGRTADELYRITDDAENMPLNQTDLDDENKFAEQVWFSAYEETRGKKPVNNIDLRDIDFHPYIHVRKIIEDYVTSKGKDYQNCNVQLAEENAVNEGPNFVNPSAIPGYDGYMESADWGPARICSLTDYGWGKIKQRIFYDPATNNYKASFVKYGEKVSEDGDEVYTVPADRDYSNEKTGDYVSWGAYTTLRYMQGNRKYNNTVPLGNDEYMFTTFDDEDGNPINLYRISYDPNPSHEQTYIDIGVYEYHHTQLEYTTEGDEVDVIWVSPLEKPDNGLPDGSSWTQPTSDLQRAIETLLSSRNDHRKEIRMMDGTFTPTYTINDHLAFYINTEFQNKSTMVEVKDGTKMYDKGVKSLTIKGGYSRDLNGVRDVELYPAVIRQQTRTDADEDNTRWDHLFYIDDPTQRYGKENYEDSNGYGLYGKDETKKVVNTIPIQFEGLTLINANATKNAKGAVIHYADLDDLAESTLNADAATNDVIVPTPINLTTRYANAADHDWDVLDEPAKIVINKTTIYGSGAHDQASDRSLASAVYLGTNGGYALLYNNVLHSNYGDPLVSMCKTHTINNTFALNGGSVNLGDAKAAGSYIHNSVLWRNNFDKTQQKHGAQFSLSGFNAAQLSAAANKDLFSYNAFTGGDTVSVDYADGQTIDKNHHNVGLIDNNQDFIYSPHFVDPLNSDLSKRNFFLQPSLRLLHKGSDERYDTLAVKTVSVEGVNKAQIDPAKAPHAIYDIGYEPSLNVDAAQHPRFVERIDIGAYEYQNQLNRVLYVNPNLGPGGDGMSWDKAFGLEENKKNLQNAIDLAALYHVNNPKEQAYVFMKGASTLNKDLHTGESLVIRDGVSVYGGIHPSFTDECAYVSGAQGARKYHRDAIDAFVKKVDGNHEGHIGPNTNKTTIYGFKTDAHTIYDVVTDSVCSFIDGFHITAQTDANPTGSITAPAIDVSPQSSAAKVVLRNIVVFNNDISAVPGGDVARMKNALIYESLFRTNKVSETGAALRLDEGAWAVSITADGRTATKVNGSYLTPFNGYGIAPSPVVEKTNRIVNSLVNFSGEDTNVPAVEYNRTKNTLSGQNYRRNDINMYYQLTEGSRHINEIELPNLSTANAFLPVHLRKFVNYATDRDLLGNPRLLTLKHNDAGKEGYHYLDRGAFETWKIEKDVTTTSVNHFAPHTGSVVYIMRGNSLVCGTEFQPGFLLLQEGANLYGNGQNVKISFLSVERTIDPDGTVVSLPFPMNYSQGNTFSDGVAKPTYKDAPEDAPTTPMGELVLTTDPYASIQLYNGTTRSNWNYEFRNVRSESWIDPTSTLVPANQGVFFMPTNITEPTLYAFTAMGASWYNNVYEETTEEKSKKVMLVQHDDRENNASDNSGNMGADFTSSENMGWNCIGLPYLVSNYQTHSSDYAAAHGFSSEYNMHLPHTLWLHYDGTTSPDGTPVNGDGGFYSVPSWEYIEEMVDGVKTNNWHLPDGETPRIWVGEGIFVQTAAVSDSVALTFHRPVPPAASPANKKLHSFNTRHFSTVEAQGMSDDRLQIGVRHRTVYVYGLDGDENIAIYDASGRCHVRAVAGGDTEWQTTLPNVGVFIIAVDNARRKVLLK